MRYAIKNGVACAMALLLLLALPAMTRAAAATAELTADVSSVVVGGTVKVTLSVSGESIAAASGSYTYDAATLTYADGTDGMYDGNFALASVEKDGAKTLTGVMEFTGAAVGETTIELKLEQVLNYAGESMDTASAQLVITVGADPNAEAELAVDHAAVDVLAHNVEGAGADMYIWRSLENLTLPSNYADTQLQYGSETVGAAQIPDSNSPMVLYLSEANGDSAGYYIYVAEQDLLYPYVAVTNRSASFIIVKPEAGVVPPVGFEQETTVEIGEKTAAAWTDGQSYLVYARNGDGEFGFFRYIEADRSVQRYIEPAVLPAATPAPAPTAAPIEEPVDPDTMTLKKPIVYGAVGLCAALLIMLVVVIAANAAKERKRRQRAAERRRKREAEENNTVQY